MSFEITGSTVVAAVIGDPVRHSLSPALHNAAYRAIGFDGLFVAFPVRAGGVATALAGARELGLVGLSVTTPHKDAIALAADQVTGTVARLGAANTVAFGSGVTVAHSTDGEGFLEDLRENAKFDPAGSDCVVLGAGGAARAVVLALGESGARSVTVVNRTERRAAEAAQLAGPVGRVGSLEDVGGAALVVNATSVGLEAGASTVAEMMARPLGAGQLVYDLVYWETPFLATAADRGATVRHGLGMLVHQAALQVEIHTGSKPPVEVMWEAVADRGSRTLLRPS